MRNAGAAAPPRVERLVRRAVRERELAWQAFLAGNLEGGDPFVEGKLPDDIAASIRRSFETWWEINNPSRRRP